jgi:two-component system chemotaxis response regulator CheY
VRILVADDDRVSLRVLQSTLARWGYPAEIATDGSEAWDVLRETEEPTLAFLDWMMPGLDGVDICRMLRERAGGPPVYAVLLTGRDSEDDRARAIEAGADAYVVKPFDVDGLKACLDSGLEALGDGRHPPGQRVIPPGDDHVEAGAVRIRGLDGDGAAPPLHRPTDDGQPDPGRGGIASGS